jgi:hypothetical protein
MLRSYLGRFYYILEGIGYFLDGQIWQSTMDKVFCLFYGPLSCEDGGMPEERRSRAPFFCSRRLSSFRSFKRAFVREGPSLKIPQKYSTGSSGRVYISMWSEAAFTITFDPGFSPNLSRSLLGMTTWPFGEVVTIGIGKTPLLGV